MKKLLSLLTVSVLGVTSITNVAAFSKTKTTYSNINAYQNVNAGYSSDYKMRLTIQLNESAWNHLMKYKNHFNSSDPAGFGGYLIQYADDNKFLYSPSSYSIPYIPDAVAFYKSNIIENYFGHFGGWAQCNTAIASSLFTNCFDSDKAMESFYDVNLKNIKITTAIQIMLRATYSFSEDKYSLPLITYLTL